MAPRAVHDKSCISLGELSQKMQMLDIKESRARQSALCGSVADSLHALPSCTSTFDTQKFKATKRTKDNETFFLSFPRKIKSPDQTDKCKPYLKRNAVNLFGTAGVPSMCQVQQGKLNK